MNGSNILDIEPSIEFPNQICTSETLKTYVVNHYINFTINIIRTEFLTLRNQSS
jgi:hypothetical protein